MEVRPVNANDPVFHRFVLADDLIHRELIEKHWGIVFAKKDSFKIFSNPTH
jgi:hypothetical protein